MTQFYTRVRAHKTLGPVFHAILGKEAINWQNHESKISDFWANAILHERVYAGNPMQVHSGISALEPNMFADWLILFDQTLSDQLTTDQALQWSTLAHRIGRGLRFGLENTRENTGPPRFL